VLHYKEELQKVFNSLCKFDSDLPIALTLNSEMKCLEYRQLGVTVLLSPLNPFIKIPEKFKLGVLMPDDFKLLMTKLEEYIASANWDETNTTFNPKTLAVEFIWTPGPGKISKSFLELELVSFTKKLPIWILKQRSSYAKKILRGL